MAFRLADLFVEFTVKGISGVQTAISTVSKSVLGFAAAGLIGTTEGNHLRETVLGFSREVSSVFLPVIIAATTALRNVTDWMRSLSAEQQDAIMKWGGAAIAVAAFGKALSFVGIAATGPLGIILTVGAGILALIASTEEGQAAFARIGDAMSRIFNIVGPPLLRIFESMANLLVTIVVPVLEALAGALEFVANAMEWLWGKSNKMRNTGMGKDHRTVTRTAGGGMEDLTATYRRIQQTGLNTDINYPKRQTELAEKQLEETRKSNGFLQGITGFSKNSIVGAV